MSSFAYVGSYTHPVGHGEGIYVYRIDRPDKWTLVQTVACVCPSFLCFNAKKDRLYVANEFNDSPEQQGEVSAYAVDPTSGHLTLLNNFSSLGVYPCHVVLDATEKRIFVANYLTGSVIIFDLAPNGSLLPNPELLIHEGAIGPSKPRQDRPHVHQVVFDVTAGSGGDQRQRALVVDLGLDRTLFYDLDETKGKLVPSPNQPPLVSHAGSGPRHAAQSNDGRFYYVINELDSTVSVFSTAVGPDGTRQELQVLPSVPSDNSGKWIGGCAELTLEPRGRFLYGSNRGHDSIVIYSVDAATGLLTLVGFEPTQGQCPRHFLIDTAGEKLYAANEKSDSVVIFRIDSGTGKLMATGQKISVPSPVCVILN